MKKFFCFGKNDFCENPVKCEGCEHFKSLGGERREAPKTNADHIRSMSDEELVNVVPCPLGFSMFRCTIEKPCGVCKREWLKQPYKEV